MVSGCEIGIFLNNLMAVGPIDQLRAEYPICKPDTGYKIVSVLQKDHRSSTCEKVRKEKE